MGSQLGDNGNRRGVGRGALAAATLVGVLIGSALSWVTATPPAGAVAAPGGFTAIPTARLLSTLSNGPCLTQRDVAVTNVARVPRDAAAVALSLTTISPATDGSLTAWPSGSARPGTSTMAYRARTTRTSSTVVRAGSGGRITLFATAGCPHVLVDVVGYFRSGTGGDAGGFVPVTPARLAASTTRTPPYCTGSNGGTLPVPVAGRGGVPVGAPAVLLNVTVVRARVAGSLAVVPGGSPLPTTLTGAFAVNDTVVVPTLARVGANGAVDIKVRTGCPALLVDVLGYVLPTATAPLTAGGLRAVAPVRASSGGVVAFGCPAVRSESVVVGGTPSVPSGAAAAMVAVTVVNPTRSGGLTAAAFGAPRPGASALTYTARTSTTNLLTVPLANGRMTITTNAGCPQVVVEVLGYFSRPTAGSRTAVTVPSLAIDRPKAIAAGGRHTCIRLFNDLVKCWGLNSSGQLGNGTTTSTAVPTAVDIGAALSLAAGADHTCAVQQGAVTAAGTGPVVCWGGNGSGQLGNGTTAGSPTAVAVDGLTTARVVAAASGRTCAIDTLGTVSNADDVVKCWGAEATVGGGATAPVTVAGTAGATAIAVGDRHACAVVPGGVVKCWGANANGQLGNGTTTSSGTPVLVTGVGSVLHLSAGRNHTCAQSAAQISCWGLNSSGQLGDGTRTSRTTAVKVPTFVAPVSVSAGGDQTCGSGAPVIDPTMRCWGSNSSGQVGDGTTTDALTPVGIALPTSPALTIDTLDVADAIGDQHACTLTSFAVAFTDVACWGSNEFGQIGPDGGN